VKSAEEAARVAAAHWQSVASADFPVMGNNAAAVDENHGRPVFSRIGRRVDVQPLTRMCTIGEIPRFPDAGPGHCFVHAREFVDHAPDIGRSRGAPAWAYFGHQRAETGRNCDHRLFRRFDLAPRPDQLPDIER